MFDFTDSANPKEIAYFDRGPLSGQNLVLSGYWSTYWYNGHIYGAEIARGIDVFRLKPSEFLSQNEIDAALQFRLQEFNSQNQPRVTWPASLPWRKRISINSAAITRSAPTAPGRSATRWPKSMSCGRARSVMRRRGSIR
jgi:hypothetical protein